MQGRARVFFLLFLFVLSGAIVLKSIVQSEEGHMNKDNMLCMFCLFFSFPSSFFLLHPVFCFFFYFGCVGYTVYLFRWEKYADTPSFPSFLLSLSTCPLSHVPPSFSLFLLVRVSKGDKTKIDWLAGSLTTGLASWFGVN